MTIKKSGTFHMFMHVYYTPVNCRSKHMSNLSTSDSHSLAFLEFAPKRFETKEQKCSPMLAASLHACRLSHYIEV